MSSSHRMVLSLLAALVGAGAGCVSEEAKHKAAGNVLFHNGDLEGAAREYRAAVAVAPNDGNAHTLLGNVLFEQNKLDEAQQAYADAIAHDGKAREAWRGIATVALRKNESATAKKAFVQLLGDTPNDPEAHAALGKLDLSLGDLDGAEQHLRAALAIASNEAGSLYCLGLTLAKKKQRAQALEVFDRLEAITPDKPFAPYGRAVAFAVSGDREEALTWLGKALDRGITDLDSVVNDPAFIAWKSEPRFATLLAEARVRAGAK